MKVSSSSQIETLRFISATNLSHPFTTKSYKTPSTNPRPPLTVMTAAPHTSSAVHHHGEQDTIVYAASGHGSIISDNGKTRQDLSPGDFALIPAWTEHQEANEGEEEVTWIITRSGSEPVVVNLKGWGEGTKE
ncbi:RmlC-like cupin domain-containing protein [Cadophora sp. MPI-SDFR-AT-0126]|nr:RmlC-like cupin domain-containing protein [Leotiomycetes sp. MPI-SDFR-AT-0126]